MCIRWNEKNERMRNEHTDLQIWALYFVSCYNIALVKINYAYWI